MFRYTYRLNTFASVKFYIKNMVCARCKMAVAAVLEKAGIKATSVELGEVEVQGEPSAQQIEKLSENLKTLGFEIIDDRKSKMIEKVKNAIVTLIHHSEEQQNLNLSDYITQQVNYDYTYLSNLFSEVEGTTIEKYFIAQKIEKVKELLRYDELTLSEIAYKLGYSSVAYLSNQFKKQTGLTPTFFKAQKQNHRINIEDL
ncbi:helix-turn-helix domain-containing protein [Mucilaginibacter limnophilus]|uniref:Helix-turn-helix domain-containing protein n=1 Tax=Mucilaginibacter limnophilus TaxID=1932778 RepID=A0A3S2Y1F1_9SPHI|nr:helix-turn-helix domain-containing protein [Mucilaginibacter limnophilus]